MRLRLGFSSRAALVLTCAALFCSSGPVQADHAQQPVKKVEPIPPPPDVAKPPDDAEKTPSGLASKILQKGTGEMRPRATDFAAVHYTGWTTDGKMFDSSVARGTPATFRLDEVIKGWTEGVQLMVEGERARFWIPENLAYKGEAGNPRGMLVFDIELIRIER
jgi:FKBP-type peptidyl-prolyl cis-trans isomerase